VSDNTSWADELLKIEKSGASGMPADEFTFTDGSNGGLDGFYFDLEMNEGVEQAARLPEAKGLSGLPDGIVTTAEDSLGFAALMNSDNGPVLDDIILDDEDGFNENDILIGDMDEETKLATLNNLDCLKLMLKTTNENQRFVEMVEKRPKYRFGRDNSGSCSCFRC